MAMPQNGTHAETDMQKAALAVLRKFERRVSIGRDSQALTIRCHPADNLTELQEALQCLVPDIARCQTVILTGSTHSRVPSADPIRHEWRIRDSGTFLRFCELLNANGIDVSGNPRDSKQLG